MNVRDYVADFDSATAMMRALSRFLANKDFPMLGRPSSFKAPLTLINRLGSRIRDRVYIAGGWLEAIPPEKISEVDLEQMSQWMVDHYPKRRYPAIAIGSSNGAATHLWAALGIPWLPQTCLIPVRHRGIHPDEPRYALEAFRKPAETLLAYNPDLQLHHMHDANQDRLMIQTMGYFRVKRLRLGPVFERFLEEYLLPGGTIFLVECGLRWPVKKVADRYYFQHGAVGGLSPEEYNQGSQRVAEYLGRYGSHRRQWDPPEPDAHAPEAEWGFEPALRASVTKFAQQRGFAVRQLCFDNPEDLSPVVADLYRWWYKKRGILSSRLLVESFILMEPWWALRTGSIPFWMVFNKQGSANALEQYLQAAGPFDELFMMLFSHGTNSIGLVPISRWKQLLQRAQSPGAFVGVDEQAYPQDFATFIRYHSELSKKIRHRYAMPPPLSILEWDSFLQKESALSRNLQMQLV